MINNQNSPILCSDVIFKSVFINNEDILNKFIYDVTGIRFYNIILVLNEIPIVRKNEKFKRCDFVIETDRNIIINIELNSSNSKTILIKNTSYIFSLFARYTSRGKKYNKDLRVIQININNFSKFDKPILDYRILNSSYGYVYLNNVSIWDLDIVRCKMLYDSGLTRIRRCIKWGKLFSCTSIDEMEFILDDLLSKKEVYRFMSKIRKMSVEYHVMDEKEALELDNKIRRSLYAEGRDEGEKIGFSNGFSNGFSDGIMSMIKSMIDNNIDIDTISKVSNKSIDEIEKIIKI